MERSHFQTDNPDDRAAANEYKPAYQQIRDKFERIDELGAKRESKYARASDLDDPGDRIGADKPRVCYRCNQGIPSKPTEFRGRPMHQECFNCQASELGLTSCRRSVFSTPYMVVEPVPGTALTLCMDCHRKYKNQPPPEIDASVAESPAVNPEMALQGLQPGDQARKSGPGYDDHPSMPVP